MNTTLQNLRQALSLSEAIDRFDSVIRTLDNGKEGPVYADIEYIPTDLKSMQFDRTLFINMLKAQRESYVESLRRIGFTIVG